MREIKKTLAGLLFILFLGYVGTTTLFYHTHCVNGQWIAHSHPYAEAPDSGQHTHTTSEFTTIASLSLLLALAMVLGYLLKLFAPLLLFKTNTAEANLLHRKPLLLSLRAPPVIA